MVAERHRHTGLIWLGVWGALTLAVTLYNVYQNVERRRLGYQLYHLVDQKRHLLARRDYLALEISRLEDPRAIPAAVAAAGLPLATPSLPMREVSLGDHTTVASGAH